MTENRSQELIKRKQFVEQSCDIDDYLTEDPPVNNQNFFIMTYILPSDKNELKHPIIKIRGSYKTQEDCSKRINQLKNIDGYFNMYVCEVGKFGSLLPQEEFDKMEDVDIQYRETMLNQMVKNYKDNKDLADEEFQKRKQKLVEKAKKEGTKEGQFELESKKENPVSVKTRIDSVKKQIQDLSKQVEEAKQILELSEKQYSENYTKEEIEEEFKKYEEFQKSEKTV